MGRQKLARLGGGRLDLYTHAMLPLPLIYNRARRELYFVLLTESCLLICDCDAGK